MLIIDDLTKKIGRKTILDHISVSLEDGTYGLLGPNGSGKTTLMRCITGIYKYNGTIKAPSNVGYLPQKFGAFRELTTYEVLEYFAELKKLPKTTRDEMICECLEDVHLSDRKKDKVKTLSGGMVRRLGVAQAILGNPQLVLVDEPTAGLDPEERLRFKDLISRGRKDSTVLISTHIVEDVEALCDHIIVLAKGKVIAQDTPENIRKAAMGHVYILPESLQDKLIDPYYVLRTEQVDGIPHLRILSNVPQQVTPVVPTLEDGYMHLIRGLS